MLRHVGHSIYYFVSRNTPLEPAELELLARHVGRWKSKLKAYHLNVPPAPGRTGVVAFGDVKTSYSMAQIERMLEAVTELRGTVPGTTAAVSDDLEMIRWDGTRYTLGPGAADADVGFPSDHVEWTLLEPIKPPRAPSGKKAKALVTDEVIDAAFDAVVSSGYSDKPLRELERNLPARIAARGLARFAALGQDIRASSAIAKALALAGDEIPDDVLAAAAQTALASTDRWRYHDTALKPVIDRAPVLDAMLDALDRASRLSDVETAARALSWVREPARATAHLIARARADRGHRRGWRDAVLSALARHGREEALPTLLLELAGGGEEVSGNALQAVLRWGVANDDRWSARVLATPGAVTTQVEELRWIAPQVATGMLDHDDWRVRRPAARRIPDRAPRAARIAALWRDVDAAYPGLVSPLRDEDAELVREARDVPVTPPLPSPIEAATSGIHDLRVWALDQLFVRCKPDELLACQLASELDIALMQRGYSRAERSWDAWRKAVPDLPTDNRERRTWIRDHARAAAAQRLTPTLERILADSATAVASEYPPPRLVLTEDERRELDEREQRAAVRTAS